MNFEELLEARTTSLQKLKKSNAVDVAAEFPEEFIRILFNRIEDLGFKLVSESKQKVLNKIREKIADTFSGGNPLFDKSNHLKFEIATVAGEEIEIEIYIDGNEFIWNVNAGRYYRQASGRTNLRSKNVEQGFEDLLYRLKAAIESPDPYSKSEEEAEDLMKKLKGKTSKPGEIVERVAKHFGMRGGQEGEKSGRGHQIYLRPTSRIIGVPREVLIKVEKGFHTEYDSFKHTYQLKQLNKAFSVLVKRLESNGYLITDLGFGGDDYLFLYVSQLNPKRINPRYSTKKTYQEVHDYLKNEQLKRYVAHLEEKAEKTTKEQAQRDFINKVFENLG